jgi:hypothetical protein
LAASTRSGFTRSAFPMIRSNSAASMGMPSDLALTFAGFGEVEPEAATCREHYR